MVREHKSDRMKGKGRKQTTHYTGCSTYVRGLSSLGITGSECVCMWHRHVYIHGDEIRKKLRFSKARGHTKDTDPLKTSDVTKLL